MKQYLDLVNHVLMNGTAKYDRTGQYNLSVFGYQTRFDLQKGFPLVTTKKIHTRSIIHELLWFIKGDSNIKYLKDNGVSIWDEWADEDGELGPVYGVQWRSWPTPSGEKIDQLENLIKNLKTNPNSRRHIISAWNVADIEDMALPPCHTLFQFYVADDKLSCQLYQRSADIFLGVPFNIGSYALFTKIVAQGVGLEPGDFVHTFGDAHIYAGHHKSKEKFNTKVDSLRTELDGIYNGTSSHTYETLAEKLKEDFDPKTGSHIAQLVLQKSREPRPLPTLELNKDKSLFDLTYDDIKIKNYDPHPHIKGKVAI